MTGVGDRSTDGRPTVSVIIPTHQRRELVKGAVASVLGQTYRDFELIVVDDGSTDGTDEALAPLGDRLRYEWQPNAGVAAARNAGIRLARGSIVAFLDSDNRWLPEHLACLVDALRRHPGALLAFTGRVTDPERRAEALECLTAPLPRLFVGSYVTPGSGVAARRSAIEEMGGFDERLNVAEDGDLWLRLALRGGPFVKLTCRTVDKGITRGSLITGRKRGDYLNAFELTTSRVLGELSDSDRGTKSRFLPEARGRMRFVDAMRALEDRDDDRLRTALGDACRLLPELAEHPDSVMNHLRFNLSGSGDRRRWSRQLAAVARHWPDRASDACAVLMAHALLSTIATGRLIETAKLLRDLPPHGTRTTFLRALSEGARQRRHNPAGHAVPSALPRRRLDLAWRAHKVVLRTGEGPLRPFWWLVHEALARAVANYLRGSERASTAAYVRGSLGRREPVFGLSDIDLVILIHGGDSDLRPRVHARWTRLTKRLPALCELMFEPPKVYDAEQVATEVEATTLTHGLDRVAAPAIRADGVEPSSREMRREHGGAERPRLYGLTHDWRLIGGRDRAPSPRVENSARHIVSWMELQFWWLQAFRACANPEAPWAPYTCVKLVTEPARVWLWLAHGEQIGERKALIDRAIDELPEEAQALRWAEALQRELSRSPRVALSEGLRALERMSSRIARRLEEGLEDGAFTDVHLLGGETSRLVVPAPAVAPLEVALAGHRPLDLRPLADWRGRVWSLPPDEAMAVVAGDPSDSALLADAARAGNEGVYAAMRGDRILVVPSLNRARLRGVQCPLTDPVSFALIEGRPRARFPELPGWSAGDSARRAAAEHLGWLRSDGEDSRSSEETLGRLLNAARAAFFLDSFDAGEPELAVSVDATADRLDRRLGAGSTLAREACEIYRAARVEGEPPSGEVVAALREAVVGMPVYRAAR